MGFNITHIINNFLQTKPHKTSADGWEDPFGSGRGHVVVSETETMKKRMARMGQIKTAYLSKKAVTAGTSQWLTNITPTDGYVAIPLKISFSTNTPAFITISWDTRPNQSTEVQTTSNYFTAYYPTAGNWTLDFSGEILIGDGANLQFNVTPDNAGFIWMSIIYAEELV